MNMVSFSIFFPTLPPILFHGILNNNLLNTIFYNYFTHYIYEFLDHGKKIIFGSYFQGSLTPVYKGWGDGLFFGMISLGRVVSPPPK